MRSMAKIGRNEPCPCGSGLKLKKCCGNPTGKPSLPPAAKAHIDLLIRRAQATEKQRRTMQGLGRPIISVAWNGTRVVAVGSTVWHSPKWRTFPDFLADFLIAKLGRDWVGAEMAKPLEERHPIGIWLEKLGELRAKAVPEKNGMVSTEKTGAAMAFWGLAYDLYLAAHNAELPDRLIERLKLRDSFEGALHEAQVIGCFAIAGFDIEMEDEDDPDTTHVEFTATHKETGRKFSVEAKAVTSKSKRAGVNPEPAWIKTQLKKALRKEAAHPRIVFVELNREYVDTGDQPEWADDVVACIRGAESGPNAIMIDGAPAPPAYVFVSNRSYLHELDASATPTHRIVVDYKLADFPCDHGAWGVLEMVEARERHIEVYMLLTALQKIDDLPLTFDGSAPEEAFGEITEPPFRIGDTYRVPDADGTEVSGVLTEAVVLENEALVWGVYSLEGGQSIIATTPISEPELRSYRRSPDTFFGVVRPVGSEAKHPLDCYDFLYKSYSESPRETLLGFMANWPNQPELQRMSQAELAKYYCAALATKMWKDHSSSGPLKPWPVATKKRI